ncbi:hypothetical protein DTL42_13300 [Bremerella cremea]|uniref:Uncharacterized protein n=1 Tax=Bremerella cremea TaxID=1031537 RepID=A0A368KRH9_9BACT|nr:hypothetical protein [Bremerella cremea]RCS49495.1 hypothetical protein DTL42_13300 [Bremerella cremea]
MSQRRSLVTGLEETPDLKALERKFVFGDKEESTDVSDATLESVSHTNESVLPQYRGRVPLTTRCRPELASALKRASLKRQLEGKEPYRIQEILEDAIEKWLRSQGYPS